MSLAAAFRAPTVGLDIGSSAVRAVGLRRGRSGWTLTGAADASFPLTESDAASPTPADTADVIRQALDGLRMPKARVAAALSGHVIVKRLSLPAMSAAELAEAIPWEAEQYIPFDLADVQIDYQVTNAFDKTASTMEVLLVAAKKDRIEDRTAAVAQAGRQTVVLDVEAFALANAYGLNYPDRTDALTALVHVGRSTTIACLLEHGQLAFTRDISIGGRLHTELLQRELGIDASTAEHIQRGRVEVGVDRDHVVSVLRDASAQLILEIRKTVDFYRATAPIETLSRLVLSGGACGAEGLVPQLQAEFGAPVEIFDPFRRISRPKLMAEADASGPAFAVAVGLAMREGAR